MDQYDREEDALHEAPFPMLNPLGVNLILRHRDEGRREERERCAKLAERYERAEQEPHYKILPREIAATIRAGA